MWFSIDIDHTMRFTLTTVLQVVVYTFFSFLADHKIGIIISCIKPELTRQYPEGELQYRTLVKTGGSGCPQPLATPLPLVTSAGGKQPGNFPSAEPPTVVHHA